MKKILIPFVSSAVLLGGCSGSQQESPSVQQDVPAQAEYERGKAEARADLKAGRPRYFYVGQPLSADSRLGDILKEEYGLTLVSLGCVPVPPVGEHAKGYNEIVSDTLGQRFGQDFIKKAWERDHDSREPARKDEGTNKELKATR